jgi:hypothetical protein
MLERVMRTLQGSIFEKRWQAQHRLLQRQRDLTSMEQE